MIPFEHVPEPAGFNEQTRLPGQTWLKNHPDAKRPRDLWSPFKNALADGFKNLCGYSVMHLPSRTGTVDHYLSFKNYPEQAYEWDNYRYVSDNLNKIKKNADEKVLDPYAVGDGWFEIILPSLQLVLTDRVPEEERARAEYTLERLKLGHGENIIRQREAWYELYNDGDLTLEGLRKMAPLIAKAVEKKMV